MRTYVMHTSVYDILSRAHHILRTDDRSQQFCSDFFSILYSLCIGHKISRSDEIILELFGMAYLRNKEYHLAYEREYVISQLRASARNFQELFQIYDIGGSMELLFQQLCM
ncbi:MAG: hypothetical protein A6F71_09980 [Cycloclasticus sp. symbiont of Poecilosclerida sp. M]|nr:MAG: hypothetical protein A6F71_09980 [Cycloclasticus sp. symbiont of Poecilosclerida sp. M]